MKTENFVKKKTHLDFQCICRGLMLEQILFRHTRSIYQSRPDTKNTFQNKILLNFYVVQYLRYYPYSIVKRIS